MSNSLLDLLRGLFSIMALILNTLFWPLLLFVLALIKLIVPIENWRNACTRLSNKIAQNWVGFNSRGLDLTKDIQWDVQGIGGLSQDKWYLLVANHQSMVDITVLQKVFHRKVPVLKFFLKQELIWVPVLGMAWWALDFPFMRRSSSARKDLETSRKACEKFRLLPVTIMNFLEGTRFTEAKREEQGSPYTHLLKPKAGGIAVVLGTMGERIHSVLDVTIVYPDGIPGLWEFLCSRSSRVIVRVREIPITTELTGDFFKDREFRRYFSNWLNTLWSEKDKLIDLLLHPPGGKQANLRESIASKDASESV